MSELILNGVTVTKRDDGMINATALCDAGRKKWNKFIKLDGTKAFIAELELGSYASRPTVDETLDGPNHLRCIWVCKELAVKLAAWISPAFEVQVMSWTYATIFKSVVATRDTIHNTTSTVEVKSKDNEIISRKRKLEMVELDQKIIEYHQKIIGHLVSFKTLLQDLGAWEKQDDLKLIRQLKCLLELQNPEIVVEPGDTDISTVSKDLGCGGISSI